MSDVTALESPSELLGMDLTAFCVSYRSAIFLSGAQLAFGSSQVKSSLYIILSDPKRKMGVVVNVR